MKKFLLIMICGASIMCIGTGCGDAGSSKSVDYARSDGSATRVTYTRYNDGRPTTVTSSHVSAEQRSSEASTQAMGSALKAIGIVVFSLIKAVL